MNIKFDELFGEIDKCFTKMETLPLPVSIICLKTSAFPTFMPRHFTTLRNNVTQ